MEGFGGKGKGKLGNCVVITHIYKKMLKIQKSVPVLFVHVSEVYSD